MNKKRTRENGSFFYVAIKLISDIYTDVNNAVVQKNDMQEFTKN